MSADCETQELANARVRLRTDLRYTQHRTGRTRWYIVEDESRGEFFRIGQAEYAFLSLLDGRRTLAEALADLASLPGGCAFDEQQAWRVTQWMIDTGLVESYAAQGESQVARVHQKADRRRRQSRGSLLAWRMPLGNPDSVLSSIYRLTKICWGWPAILVWLLVCGFGFGQLAWQGPDWELGWLTTISPADAWWFAVAWLVMKIAHEGAHGLACKHYGGRVSQFGILWLLLIPLPYVDVTSSWRFRRKYQRALTAAAGMLAELFIAALAAIVWCWSEPGPWRYHAGNLLLAGTVNTLFFNLNPLMRFDGYHLLVDGLDLPNLYQNGRQAIKGRLKSWFFGTPTASRREGAGWRRQFIFWHGGLALIWQVLVSLSLGIAAANLMPGIGLVLLAIGLGSWLGRPLWQLAVYLYRGDPVERPNRGRFAAILVIVGVALTALMLAPAPPTIRAPLVLQQNFWEGRAVTEGEIVAVHVQPGAVVASGDLLVTLANPELQAELQHAEVDWHKLTAEATRYLAESDIELWQLTQEHLAGLDQRLSQLREWVEQLELRASVSGVVMMDDAACLLGQHVQPGDELLRVLSDEQVRGVALVSQSDAHWLREHDGSRFSVMIWGQGGERFPCNLTSVHPRASFDLPHAAFAASFGGPLAVLDRNQVNSARDNQPDSLLASTSQQPQTDLGSPLGGGKALSDLPRQALAGRASQSLTEALKGVRTVQPFVRVEFELLTPDDGRDLSTTYRSLREGQSGVLFASSRRMRLGNFLGERLRAWFHDQFQLIHGL